MVGTVIILLGTYWGYFYYNFRYNPYIFAPSGEKQRLSEYTTNLPRVGFSVTLKGSANDAMTGEGTQYLFSPLQHERRSGYFEFIPAECTRCNPLSAKWIELKDGRVKLSTVLDENGKIVEVQGILQNGPVIIVDAIREIQPGDLERPPAQGLAKFILQALNSGDPNACKNHDNRDPNSCLLELAMTLQDEAICRGMTDKILNEPYTSDHCYEALAYIKLDRLLCENLNIPWRKQQCLDNLTTYTGAIRSGNTSQCKTYQVTYPEITDVVGEASCVAEYAWQTKNLSSCDKLWHSVLKVFYTNKRAYEYEGINGQEWCIYRNSLLKGDGTQCDSLTDPFAREVCRKNSPR